MDININEKIKERKECVIEYMKEDDFYHTRLELSRLIKLIEDNIDPYYLQRFENANEGYRKGKTWIGENGKVMKKKEE